MTFILKGPPLFKVGLMFTIVKKRGIKEDNSVKTRYI